MARRLVSSAARAKPAQPRLTSASSSRARESAAPPPSPQPPGAPGAAAPGPDVNSARTSHPRRSAQSTSKAELDEEKSFPNEKARDAAGLFMIRGSTFCAFGILTVR